MRWTRAAPKTRALVCGRRSRVVLTPRRWRQVGDDASHHADDGGKQARSPGRARNKLLKPSRAGMPGDPGATVVTNACAYYTSRTRLRVQRAPGIPRALLRVAPLPLGVAPRPPFQGEGFSNNSGAVRRGNEKPHLAVIASSEATKQSILSFYCSMDCFASLAMTVSTL